MKEKYTIADICESLNTHKTKIRRTISDLGIEAINEQDRKHENSPKFYSEEAKREIMNELKIETKAEQEQNRSRTEAEQEQNNETQNAMIELLKEQLNRADRDKQELVRALQEAQQLVNQQQRLSLQANHKIDILELELKEKKEGSEKLQKKTKKEFFRFFRKK